MSLLTTDIIKRIAPRANIRFLNDLVESLNTHLIDYRIDTHDRVTHFLAQAAHETDGFFTMEEYASGKAYEGRKDLGNDMPGDGVRYKGRGIFQLTGKYNYKDYGNRIGLDLVANPFSAAIPDVAVQLACEYWNRNKLSTYADNDDILTITKRINGGTNGLDDRKRYLSLAKRHVPTDIFEDVELVKEDIINRDVFIKLNDRGPQVKRLQEMLYEYGYDIIVDGIFGPRTEVIVKDYQSKHKLPVTGIVDDRTFDQLSFNE
jgi:putative chitinase